MSPSDAAESQGKRKALGRGLSALFDDDEVDRPTHHAAESAAKQASDSAPSGGRKLIAIAQLVPGIYQPRQTFHDESLAELSQSIATHGLLQPILVRPKPDADGLYEIVAGERRWRAAQLAQIHEVPVIIRDLDDTTTLEIALIENLQREDLNPLEEARALQQLMDNFDYTQEEVAAKVGKSRPYVANMLRLTRLSTPVLALLQEGKISAGHARALHSLEEAQQEEAARKIVALGLNVRQTEKMVQDLQGAPVKAKLSKVGGQVNTHAQSNEGGAEKDVNTRALEREVSNILGMNVTIGMQTEQEGVMEIRFKSLDQLDEVLHRLSHNPGRLAIRG